jgi:hypothetical protein
VAHEIEAAAVDGASAFLRRKPRRALPVGGPCPNCATPLQGAWCHACGQAAEDYHRSIWRLTAETVSGLFELDGRLWRTLPNLLLNPAKLTRSYLDGHRAPQAPPFRTFLIVVVLVFVSASVGSKTHTRAVAERATVESEAASRDSMFDITGSPEERRIAAWFNDRIKAAKAHPEAFDATLQTWAQRMAVLALPLSAMLLGLLFLFRRGVYMFDHLIFSMHSLSFQGLLASTVMLLDKVWSGAGWLILLSPTHLFFHMRGTYGLGVIGTLLRMFLLFIGSVVGLALFMVGLLLIGLYEVGG